MDFEELYRAVKSDNQQEIDELINKIIPILMSYLRTTMRAPVEDAKDCIQDTLLHTIIKIRTDKIQKPSKLYYYMLTACRNLYLRMCDNPNISLEDSDIEYAIHPASQLEALLDTEKQDILRECKKILSKRNQEYIEYWFENPDSEAIEVAEYFKISLSNAWTRKHRIIKKLNKCIRIKQNR
ncbi:MAG TPA: sigma-70 family RNA polymerase sigma factor [Balneolales bacterium]|nr:sigma-70 family RNA polymerase sigma factor [Balneolales bacterium]